jgi:hypothetical protein
VQNSGKIIIDYCRDVHYIEPLNKKQRRFDCISHRALEIFSADGLGRDCF